MKVIESAGKTREEAIQNGLKELGVDMHDLEKIDVIDEGSRGFLGIGARPVRVRLTADRPDDSPRRGGNRQERQERRGDNRNERQGQRGGDRQDRPEQRGGGNRQGRPDQRGGGNRQDRPEQRGGGNRQDRPEQRGGGNRQDRPEQRGGGNRQDRPDQRGGQPRDENKRRDGAAPQADTQEGGRRKKKQRSRSGGGAPDNRGADNRPDGRQRQQQANAHRATPIVGQKNNSVTDEASEALRRAENFENEVGNDNDVTYNELPPDARAEEVIETITDEQGKEAAAMLSETLGLMELGGQVTFSRQSDGSARLSIESEEDGGILIGKRGVTLHAIQYLVNRMIAQNEASDNAERVVVDVGGYVDRRQNTLADMARSMAKRAKDSGRNVRLKPLSPQERRIVHLTLEPDPLVRTYSLGDSLFRSIVINPVGGRDDEPNRRDRGPRDQGPRDRGPRERDNADPANE